MRFHVPTRIEWSPGALFRIPNLVKKEIGAERIFLVTDKGIQEAGIADRVVSQLEKVTVFDEVEANPKHTTVNRAGERVRIIQPDWVIGLGGGSSLDAAKAVALLAENPGKIEDYEGKGKYKNPPLPVLAVPTTCGTGSEVTWVSVVTHTERKFKMSIKGPHLFPAVALLDPDLLISLPPPLVASTGLDALTHAIEAYTVKPATLLTDVLAKEAIRLIFQSLEPAFASIIDHPTERGNMMMGSALAGMAFGNSDVGGVHCLAESVGALHDTPHGVVNSVFLPYVMEFNLPQSYSRYAEIARLIGIKEREDNKAAQNLIHRVRELSQKLSIPSFKALGIQKRQFPEIARKSVNNNSNPSNPRKAEMKDYLDILSRAYEES